MNDRQTHLLGFSWCQGSNFQMFISTSCKLFTILYFHFPSTVVIVKVQCKSQEIPFLYNTCTVTVLTSNSKYKTKPNKTVFTTKGDS